MRKLATSLFIACMSTLFAQSSDPHWTVWRNTMAPDTARLLALAKALNIEYGYAHPDSTLEYARQMATVALRSGNRKWQAYAERRQGDAWYSLQNLHMALDHHRANLKMEEELADTAGIISARISIGVILLR